jgi:urease accessory protein
MADLALLRLLHIADPTLPIGGFAHSAGLETYVQEGIVHNKTTALQFVTGQLSQNLRHTDAALASLAFDAAKKEDLATLVKLDQTCHALKLPREMREASHKLGLRLAKILEPLYPYPLAQAFRMHVKEKTCIGHYCVVFGMFGAQLGIEKLDALKGFYYNAAAGMITNSVKLVPLGQQEGQEILCSLHPVIDALAIETMAPDPQTIGMCSTGFDIRSMQHERLYSRLYMS